MAFLDHIIANEGVEVDPRKIEAMRNCPRRFKPISIRIFLGLAGYYRRFEDGFASITYPLTTLTQKSVTFEMLEAC